MTSQRLVVSDKFEFTNLNNAQTCSERVEVRSGDRFCGRPHKIRPDRHTVGRGQTVLKTGGHGRSEPFFKNAVGAVSPFLLTGGHGRARLLKFFAGERGQPGFLRPPVSQKSWKILRLCNTVTVTLFEIKHKSDFA